MGSNKKKGGGGGIQVQADMYYSAWTCISPFLKTIFSIISVRHLFNYPSSSSEGLTKGGSVDAGRVNFELFVSGCLFLVMLFNVMNANHIRFG